MSPLYKHVTRTSPSTVPTLGFTWYQSHLFRDLAALTIGPPPPLETVAAAATKQAAAAAHLCAAAAYKPYTHDPKQKTAAAAP
jgi:hypothetical protein